MKKISEAERRAQVNRGRATEAKTDIVARFLSRTPDGRLLATFPNHFGVMSKGPIDLTHLDKHPGLRDAFAYGYVLHCLGDIGADRRYVIDQSIKGGFLAYLADKKISGLSISDITETTLQGFKSWLDDEKSNGFSRSKLTRKQKIEDLQLVLRKLMLDDKWRQVLSPNLRLLDRLYPNAHRDVEHTDILDDATLERLYIACADDCEDTIRTIEAQDAALTSLLATGGVTDPATIAGDPIRCAAFLIHQFGDRLPIFTTIRNKVAWGRAIDLELYFRARAVLHPSIDEILPFVLLLSLLFAFNPGVVMNMTLDDYDDDDTFLGRPRIRLFPDKPRKGGPHRGSVLKTDDFDNPARLLAFLEGRTERTRRVLKNEAFADRVFIWMSAMSPIGLPLEQSDKNWRTALKSFCERHSIDYFTLQQLRPTTLDLVHEVTGGDLVSTQEVAGHETQQTTHQSYTSPAMAARMEEMLGGGINQLWRFMASGGKVDATERDRLNADLGSATPGFGCIDPYDSPVKGERKGALCAAYGRCPMCEHAMIDLSSPHAYAYQRELLRVIDEAQQTLGPAWLHRWSAVKTRLLTHCLDAVFPRETILASGTVSIPALPPVD